MRIWLALVAVGCSATPAPVVSRHAPASVTLVVVHDRSMRFVATTPRGLDVRREVTLPSEIAQLEVASSGPIVMLDDRVTIGRITAQGYEPVPAFPDGTFAKSVEAPRVALEVDDAGDAWRGECETGGIQDGGWCSKWVFAKIGSNPVETRTSQSLAASVVSLPLLPAPPSPIVAIVPRTVDGHSDVVNIVICTVKGKTVEYPPAGERQGFVGVADVMWIEREPPVFRVVRTDEGYQSFDTPVYFEGCLPSKRFAGATTLAGPNDTIAIVADNIVTVLVRGHEIGHIDGAGLVGFLR